MTPPISSPTTGAFASVSPTAVVGPWQPSGTMAIGRAFPRAVLLADGRVLVVGNDSATADGAAMTIRSDSVVAELWDPVSQGWRRTAGLNAPRGGFVAASLQDGRAVVAGGLDQGSAGCDPGAIGGDDSQRSFSSTYVFDPRSGAWSTAGLLGTARTAAAAAVLPDGRVLVAGGYFYTGLVATQLAPAVALAAYRAGSGATDPAGRGPDDVVFPPAGVALATAEIFDPATGTWSPTGALRYARFGAAAVTLADGRVLVVGSDDGTSGQVARVADGAYDSAEIYDPATGRFDLTGPLPPIDPSLLARFGGPPAGQLQTDLNGALVALKDGGALLIGRDASWKHEGEISRSFRFDARTGTWTEVGTAWATGYDPLHDAVWTTPGDPLGDQAVVARLADGRVLVAGGSGADGATLRTAEVFDPTTGTWSSLAPMPEPRAGGAAVALADGSVLLVGGFNDATLPGTCDEPSGLSSTIRFVPQP